jgi:hypothetical protein
MAQVTELHDYQYLYVGRLASDGSTVLNIGAGFTKSPSLDAQADGQTIDDHIFSFSNIETKRVTQPRTGLAVTVTFGDHPHNTVPWTFENRETHSTNFLARIRRVQHFVVYFVTRASKSSPLRTLGRLGWAVTWDFDVNWTLATMRPTLSLTRSELFPGTFKLGPPPPGDNWARIALDRTGPTTNDQDRDSVNGIYNARKAPACVQSKTPPAGFRSNFFR